MSRPNVLLITTDTQRTDTLACMGNPHAHSPHLDRLAREGVLFSQAHSPAPVCMPARCSLLTGVHAPVHGAIENGYNRFNHLETLPDWLDAAGYTNIMVGKTHFEPVPDSFHVRVPLGGGKKSTRDDAYARHLRRHGYERVSAHPNPIPPELHLETFLVDETIAAIEQALTSGRAPFFAWCSLLSPHSPLDPPGEWAEIYRDTPLPPLNYRSGEVAEHPDRLRRLFSLEDGPPAHAFTPDGLPRRDVIDAERRLYYGLAAFCDHQVGRLLQFLDQRGLREETLVIFSSDHGTTLYDHGFYDKHNYYDESWRVPLIMSLPGTLQQGERRGFALWNDITASILGAAGVDAPSVQGFDLFGALAAGRPSPRLCAAGTLYKSCAVSGERWKLEYDLETGRGRLFDRRLDPAEQCDLWESADHEPVRNALLIALLTWRADLTDVQHAHEKVRGSGPVAVRVGEMRRRLRGSDAEARLGEAVVAIEARFGG